MEMYSEEYDHYGYLEELLGLRGESSAIGLNQELCTSGSDNIAPWINTYSNESINHDYSPPLPIDCSLLNEHIYNCPFGIGDQIEFPSQDYGTAMNYSAFGNESDCNLVETHKFDAFQLAEVPTTFNMGSTDATITTGATTTAVKGTKKLNGQPSKNLMAERRRRKRLNDRLSMLRSVVPKISKMDRTSILGDTIVYMKELLERINNLQEAIDVGTNQLTIFKDVKPNEILVRNSPKFDVERRNGADTRIDVCCAGKPGLLLSTLTTLEALGLHIQHCVISCFNEFAMQASCLEKEHRAILNLEDIKQALFRNAGYGGRCL